SAPGSGASPRTSAAAAALAQGRRPGGAEPPPRAGNPSCPAALGGQRRTGRESDADPLARLADPSDSVAAPVSAPRPAAPVPFRSTAVLAALAPIGARAAWRHSRSGPGPGRRRKARCRPRASYRLSDGPPGTTAARRPQKPNPPRWRGQAGGIEHVGAAYE